MSVSDEREPVIFVVGGLTKEEEKENCDQRSVTGEEKIADIGAPLRAG